MTIHLLTGDARDVLPTLASNSVHCVVTSPPYYGLRDYGTALWDGGDAGCDHVAGMARQDTERETPGGRGGSFRGGEVQYRDTCGKCGAVRIDRQIGLEPTPDAYIATMVAVFREVKRVLRPDGTCWVNMGDSYSGGKQGRGDTGPGYLREGRTPAGIPVQRDVPPGYKPKDLLMMPARLALALQADGWWLRSDIIWSKPNPMPESCTDRPTSAHEHVFLLTRSARYFYDADAVREANETANPDNPGYRPCVQAGAVGSPNGVKYAAPDDPRINSGASVKRLSSSGRNLRNVWTIATSPYAEAHFATYPPALVERCIRAGTSERGCCAACGAPWVRITERIDTGRTQKMADGWDAGDGGHGTVHRNGREAGAAGVAVMATTTTGWRAGCQCNAGDPVPCTVLDCFLGSGTTALVADRLQRHCVGIDLSLSYADLARNRITADCPLFTSWAPAEPPEDERMADLFAGDEYQRVPKSLTTPRHDGSRWNENNGRGFLPRPRAEAAE